MYLLITKAHNYQEIIVHWDKVASIVPNGKIISVFTHDEIIEAIYVKAINEKAMRDKCRQWIKEIFDEEIL